MIELQDAVKRFRSRRAVRLGIKTSIRYDSVEEYRRRRAERMGIHLDADDDETTGQKKGGHGNTKLPFGLCQREGIEVQKGWTPEEAWKALEGKGYSAGESYQELKKTGKVSAKGAKPVKKDYSKMDYDTLMKEYEDHNRRYQEREERYNNQGKDIKAVKGSLGRVKMIKERGDYHGETYEDLMKFMEQDDDQDYPLHSVMKKAMDTFGHDVFEKDIAEVEKIAEKKIKKLEEPIGFGDLNEERESIQTAMASAAKAKYKKLSNCDSAAALEARTRADDFFNIGDYMSKTMDYKDLDDRTASGIGKGLETLRQKFPKLKGYLTPPLVNDDVAQNAYAHCETGAMYDAQVVLNKWQFRNADHLLDNLKSDVKSGFHPKGTGNIQSVVTHEYGHAIDDLLTKKFSSELKGKQFSEYVLSRIATEQKTGRTEVLAQVSKYALNNGAKGGQEFLAEAFSEYCGSSKPRPIAVQVGQIMTEYINKL